jgi:oxygen-independent coproporphyrinogen-3 oxidase
MLTKEPRPRAAARVPRYTSYPTAPHFTKAVGPLQVARWYAAIGTETPVSVYVHVPFCSQLCWYCGCNTSITSKYSSVHNYLETLLRELGHARKLLRHRLPVGQIHFGGGTPNALSSADFARLADVLHDMFDIGVDTRFDVELDPRTLDAKMAATLVAAGHRVLAHCGMGLNRSALVAGLALVRMGIPAAAAVDLIRERRPGALYNENFVRHLLDHGRS